MAARELWSFFFLPMLVCLLQSLPLMPADYTAAVVEHKSISWLLPFINGDQALAIMKLNLDVYDYYASVAVSKGADIIVFPEYGITGFVHEERDYILPYLESVPNPSSYHSEAYIPCHEKSIANITIQYRLSCLALKRNITVVANLMTLQSCDIKIDPNCPEDGRYQYNTDVAFANNGQLVARYRKENLYTGEAKVFNPGQNQTEVAAFRTAFGYFGLFTCFDLLFPHPAEILVNKLGVDTMVFPTAWMNELPLLSAAEYQQAWSISYGVNLLAANQHYPIAQMTGSGIFSPVSGAVTFIYDMESILGKMVVGKIETGKRAKPKPEDSNHVVYKDASHSSTNGAIKSDLLSGNEGGHSKESSVLTMRRGHYSGGTVPKYFTATLNDDPYNLTLLEGKGGHLSVSNNNVSCSLDFSRSSDSEMYALGAFDGLHTTNGDYYIQCCALIRCKSDSDPYKCGAEASEASTVFQDFDLRIEGQSPQTRFFPEVVSSGVGLPPVREAWEFSAPMDHVWSSKEGVTEPLLAVNIFGRWYQRD